MRLIKRNTSKRQKAKKAAGKAVKAWGITKVVQAVPKRAVSIGGGAVAAVAGALAIKKRKSGSDTPAYTPPTPAPPSA